MPPTHSLSKSVAAMVAFACAALLSARSCADDTGVPTPERIQLQRADVGKALMLGLPGYFVPNLGQWGHDAQFVHRSGPMTLFLESRGWVIVIGEQPSKLVTAEFVTAGRKPSRHVALRMSFEGETRQPELIGGDVHPGHHNYFLGNDTSRWRTEVPLYGSVLYKGLFPSVDLRLRDANGVPEYDLLLKPGANLESVRVRVEGAESLSITADGSLCIATALGPLTQPVPKTWQVDDHGERHEVICEYVVLDASSFGFSAPAWDGESTLTIDPPLIWSTLLDGVGGRGWHAPGPSGLAVAANGNVTLAGWATFGSFPTTLGAFDRTIELNGIDSFVSQLDPSKTGGAQLVYSTYLGGKFPDVIHALDLSSNGVVTVAGVSISGDFPTTKGAFATSQSVSGAGYRVFVSSLDPSLTGNAQLTYSTFLGIGTPSEVIANQNGLVVTVVGSTASSSFPTTKGAFDTTSNGHDIFVSRLLTRGLTGKASLIYSSFLGGKGEETSAGADEDAFGRLTLSGTTNSRDFPTVLGAFRRTFTAGKDHGFVSQMDLSKVGNAQLTYSTCLGLGRIRRQAVDANGVVTIAGVTKSSKFPITSNAYDSVFGLSGQEEFLSRLDPRKAGAAQLTYSTFRKWGAVNDLQVDENGVITMTGLINSIGSSLPATSDAYSTKGFGGGDGFLSCLDPKKKGAAQVTYATYFGGAGADFPSSLAVDGSGVVTVVGTANGNYLTTSGAYLRSANRFWVGPFLSRLEMGVDLWGDTHEIALKTGGSVALHINAGQLHAGRTYWVVGSASGTKPGVTLSTTKVPLNVDIYTDLMIANKNSAIWTNTFGKLDAAGRATARITVPATLGLPSFTLHHAYVVFNKVGGPVKASQSVPVLLR